MTTRRRRERVKPVLAWAIVHKGKIALYDYRLPLMWLRSTAKDDAAELFYGNARIARVEIREVRQRKGE